ncbi:MAG TPA: hypothetical protein VGB31_00455 [Myxococcota bacterium]
MGETSVMHPTGIRGLRWALAIAALVCLLAPAALAGDRPWEQERWRTAYAGFSANGEDLSLGQRWLESEQRADNRHEFEYIRGLSLGAEDNFVFSIQSPPSGEWAPGLAFEVRF